MKETVKKEYNAPEAKKIEFSYEENVVASDKQRWNQAATTGAGTHSRCICRACKQVTTAPPW